MTPTILIWTIGVMVVTAAVTVAIGAYRRREIDGMALAVVWLTNTLALVLAYFMLWGG